MVKAPSHAPLRHKISWVTIFGFYILLLLITWLVYLGEFSTNVDRLLHDVWVRDNMRAVPEDVVIVGIDHASLSTLGRWPWPRVLQTNLFNKLAKGEPRAVAADLLYIEPAIDSADDVRLGRAIARNPIVILPLLTEGQGVRTQYVEKTPIPEVIQHADLGHIYTPLDSDGIVRRVALKSGHKSAHWSAFSLALAQATGDIPVDAELPGLRMTSPLSNNLWVEDYVVLIPYYGPSGSFTTVSAVDVISDNLPEGYFKDKIVFVGSTATGLGDVLPTAVSGIDAPMPGVEIHANIFAMLRDGAAIEEMDSRYSLLVAALLLAALLALYSFLSPFWALVCLGLTTVAPVVLSYLLYHSFGYWYAPLTASIPILFSYFVWSWHRLEFVADFLRRETHAISQELTTPIGTDNALLVSFFEKALRHLPLDGWRFSAAGKEYSGGLTPAKVRFDSKKSSWSNSGDSWRKRYKTKGKLDISVRAQDTEFAAQFLDYIDSLSRVKERQHTPLLSAPLERVQSYSYELRKQLDRLRQLKVLSESIFAGSPAGLVVWSASGELVSINALAQKMYPRVDFPSLSLIEFVEIIGRDPLRLDRSKVDELILQRVPWQINQVEQDTELVINFSAVGDRLADRLISASIVDVSDIRRSERSRAEMVDFLSHDLRSPLISSLYLLKDTDPLNEIELKSRFERMETNINLSLTMIDDLLSIARADNLTRDQFNLVLFELIVGNATNQISPVAHGRKIKLDIITLEDEDLWVECDASLMERALTNVLSNAIKYSPDNTTIRIETERMEESLVFRVADQGVGIAPEMMANLFQRFKRDKEIQHQYKGIGLGLALVYKVITEHGGTVRAESPGLGTVVVITLPLAEAEEESVSLQM